MCVCDVLQALDTATTIVNTVVATIPLPYEPAGDMVASVFNLVNGIASGSFAGCELPDCPKECANFRAQVDGAKGANGLMGLKICSDWHGNLMHSGQAHSHERFAADKNAASPHLGWHLVNDPTWHWAGQNEHVRTMQFKLVHECCSYHELGCREEWVFADTCHFDGDAGINFRNAIDPGHEIHYAWPRIMLPKVRCVDCPVGEEDECNCGRCGTKKRGVRDNGLRVADCANQCKHRTSENYGGESDTSSVLAYAHQSDKPLCWREQEI
jgi:hypothetical protein